MHESPCQKILKEYFPDTKKLLRLKRVCLGVIHAFLEVGCQPSQEGEGSGFPEEGGEVRKTLQLDFGDPF